MATHNPKTLGVASEPTVVKSMVDTTTAGEALVTSVTVDPGSLQSTYSGVDEGTGHVHISLPRIPGSAGRTFNTVVVDDYGRVVGGAEGSLDGEYVLNSPGTRQSGGFYLDTGDVTSLQAMNINATSIAAASLSLSTPLTPANGGTGVSSVLARLAFLGPVSGAGVPSFRSITTSDLPDYPFSRLTGTPTTLAGYGIADAYDKTTSDTRYSLSGHAHAGVYEPAFAAGTTAQYLRGDKSWQNLTTDVVQETATRKFYTDAYARAAISVSGTNLTYDNLGGIIGFVASPSFTSVSVSTATLPQHAAPISLVDNKIKYRTPGVADPIPPSLVDNGNGTVTIASANVTVNSAPDFSGSTATYSISGTTLALTAGLEQYICVRYNSGAPQYYVENNRLNITASDVVGIYVVWLVGTEVHSISLDSRGLGLASKTASMLTMTMPYMCAIGHSFVLGETATPSPRTVTISSSLVFAGTDALNIAALNSSNPAHRLTLVYPVAGTWTYRNDLVYDNTNYSNGTNLVAASSNKYVVRWVYRTIGDDVQAFYVIGSDQYNSVDAARHEIQPSNLPIVVRNHAMLVGRIIVQYGASSGVIDQVSTTSFNVGSITQHNSLGAIQGGIATERYHLSEAEYLRVQEGPHLRLDGLSPMTGTLTSQAILPETNTTYNIGSSTYRYATIYSSILNTTGLVSGTSYIGSIIPYNNESFYYDIGTNLYRYNRIYAKDITINGFSTTASSIDIGAGYRINLSGYLSSQPQMNWPTNYSSSVVAGDMSWDGTKLKVGDGTVQRVFAYTSDITSQSLSGFATGSNTAIVQSDSILQAFQKTQGQINARALTSDLGNYLPKVNPTYTGRLTGPEQYLENDGQILLSVRRPGGFSGRIHGIAFQAQTLDGTWVDFGRVTSYISSVADGAQIGGMRLYSYNAGAIVTALDAGPTSINIGSGLTLQMNGTTVIDASRNATLNLITAAQATIGTTGQESVILRRPGATTNLLWGLDFQGQTADLTWVNYNRVQSRIVSTANGAQTGYLRLVNYNAGTQVNTVEVAPTYVDFTTGVVLRMAGSQLVDTNKNITMGDTLTLSTGAGTQANVIFRSSTEHWTSFYVTTTEAGFRDYNADGSSNSYPIYWTLKSGGILRLTRITNMLQGFQINGTTCVDASRNATFVGLVATGNPVFGSTAGASSTSLNSATGTSSSLNLQSNSVSRATVQLYNDTLFRVMARNTAGTEIDIPIQITLASGGELLFGGSARPSRFTGALTVPSLTVGSGASSGQVNLIANSTGSGTFNVDFFGAATTSRRMTVRWNDTTDTLIVMTSNDDGSARADRLTIPRSSSSPVSMNNGLSLSSGDFAITSLASASVRPAVLSTSGVLQAQDVATFRTTLSVLPYTTVTGAVDFNNIGSGAVGNYRVQGSSYTNAPAGASSSVTYDLWQGNAGGRLVQRVTDTWWGGAYHRFQIGASSNAWSPWLDIWDSGLLPTTTLTRSFLAASTTSAARSAINAAAIPEKTTKNGSWSLDSSTPLCIVQTATGTLTLPAASSTYQCKSYIITASTTVTLTIAGSYCYLDALNSASYWYDTSTSVNFTMNGGHVAGNRKMIEIWCDGIEWYVRC